MSRRRYRYDEATKQMVEVGAEWTDTPRRAQTATEELTYGGVRATDGTPINSRKKHREYMKEKGLAMAGDFTGTWERAAADRERVSRGENDRTERRDAIGRALYERRRR